MGAFNQNESLPIESESLQYVCELSKAIVLNCRDEKSRPRGLMITRGYIVNMKSKICAPLMFSKVHF